MRTDFDKNWLPYSWIYNLQNGLELRTIPVSYMGNGDFKHSDYLSIYIAVLLAVHVFDCDVTGVPCEEVACECDHHLIFLTQLSKNIPEYTSMKRKTRLRKLIFIVPFTLSFWISFCYTIKYLNSPNA